MTSRTHTISRYRVQKKRDWPNTHWFSSWLGLSSSVLLKTTVCPVIFQVRTCKSLSTARHGLWSHPLPHKQNQKELMHLRALAGTLWIYTVYTECETQTFRGWAHLEPATVPVKNILAEKEVTVPCQSEQRANYRKQEYLIQPWRRWCWRVICLLYKNKTNSNLPKAPLDSSAFLGLPSYPDAEEVLQLPGRKF